MKTSRAALIVLVLLSTLAVPAWSQLSPPNSMGVAMGHLHYVVRDVATNRKFWVLPWGPVVEGGRDRRRGVS